jgi:hypothetical protein
VVLLLPTTLLGAAFPPPPVSSPAPTASAGTSGTTLALNTAGGIVGTLVTGFVLVPWLGLVRTLAALAVAGALLGALAVLRGGRGRIGAWLGATAMVLAAAVLGLTTPRDKLATLLAEKRGGRLVFYSEDTGGTVAVLEQGEARRASVGSTSRESRTPATR